jgi:hypothetical protein
MEVAEKIEARTAKPAKRAVQGTIEVMSRGNWILVLALVGGGALVLFVLFGMLPLAFFLGCLGHGPGCR